MQGEKGSKAIKKHISRRRAIHLLLDQAMTAQPSRPAVMAVIDDLEKKVRDHFGLDTQAPLGHHHMEWLTRDLNQTRVVANRSFDERAADAQKAAQGRKRRASEMQ